MATQKINFFILAGMPKSGTSMLCNLIDKIGNVTCLDNDVSVLNSATSIRRYLEYASGCIFNKEPVHYGDCGEMIIEFENGPSFLGVKHDYGFLQNIVDISELGYPMFAVIRDPVYTIADWTRSGLVAIDWRNPSGKRRSHAEVWNDFVGIIQSNFPADRIYKYEDLINQTKYRLMHFCSQLGAEYDLDESDLPKLTNRNDDSLYPGIDLDAIRSEVREHAPLALEMGYRV